MTRFHCLARLKPLFVEKPPSSYVRTSQECCPFFLSSFFLSFLPFLWNTFDWPAGEPDTRSPSSVWYLLLSVFLPKQSPPCRSDSPLATLLCRSNGRLAHYEQVTTTRWRQRAALDHRSPRVKKLVHYGRVGGLQLVCFLCFRFIFYGIFLL